MSKTYYITVQEASKLSNIPAQTIYNWCRRGKIKSKNKKGRWLVLRSEVMKKALKNRSAQTFGYLSKKVEELQEFTALALDNANKRHDEIVEQMEGIGIPYDEKISEEKKSTNHVLYIAAASVGVLLLVGLYYFFNK